jgi:hypothetical protein
MEPLAGQAALYADSGSSTGVSVSLNERWICLWVAPTPGYLVGRIRLRAKDIEYCIGIQAKQNLAFRTLNARTHPPRYLAFILCNYIDALG